MAVLAIIEDLLFSSKLSAAAVQLGVELDTATAVPSTPKSWTLAVVDLHLSSQDPLEIIRGLKQQLPGLTVVGFGSHVETELFSRAREAGCDCVLPRSAFVQRLPELLQGRGM